MFDGLTNIDRDWDTSPGVVLNLPAVLDQAIPLELAMICGPAGDRRSCTDPHVSRSKNLRVALVFRGDRRLRDDPTPAMTRRLRSARTRPVNGRVPSLI